MLISCDWLDRSQSANVQVFQELRISTRLEPTFWNRGNNNSATAWRRYDDALS